MASVETAARALARGALVVHPTDTLYALAARATDPDAVARLLAVKGRSVERRISVAVSSVEELETWLRLTPAARAFARDKLPGPFTLLGAPTSAARRRFPPAISGGDLLGARVPDHPLARELARRLGPLTATSANRTGEPPATTLAEARRALGREVAVYIDMAPRPTGRPSTLVDVSGRAPKVRERR